MKKITKLLVFSILLMALHPAQAMVAAKPTTHPTGYAQNHRKHPLRLKLGLWLLKRKIKKLKKHRPNLFRIQKDSLGCQTILLKSGDQIQVNLIESTESAIVFTRCPSNNDTISLSKSDIAEVRLADGLLIYSSFAKTKHNKSASPNNNKLQRLSLLLGGIALLLFAISPILGGIFSLVATILSVKSVLKNPIGHRGADIIALLLGVFGIILVLGLLA